MPTIEAKLIQEFCELTGRAFAEMRIPTQVLGRTRHGPLIAHPVQTICERKAQAPSNCRELVSYESPFSPSAGALARLRRFPIFCACQGALRTAPREHRNGGDRIAAAGGNTLAILFMLGNLFLVAASNRPDQARERRCRNNISPRLWT